MNTLAAFSDEGLIGSVKSISGESNAKRLFIHQLKDWFLIIQNIEEETILMDRLTKLVI